MSITDERLDQIARNLLAYEISEACADPQYQKGALYGALDGYDRMDGIEQDELLARFGAALRRVKAELIQEGNGYYGAQNHHLHVQVEPGTVCIPCLFGPSGRSRLTLTTDGRGGESA